MERWLGNSSPKEICPDIQPSPYVIESIPEVIPVSSTLSKFEKFNHITSLFKAVGSRYAVSHFKELKRWSEVMIHLEGVDVNRVPSLIENGLAFLSSPYPILDPQRRKRKGRPRYSRKVSSIKVSRTKLLNIPYYAPSIS